MKLLFSFPLETPIGLGALFKNTIALLLFKNISECFFFQNSCLFFCSLFPLLKF